jgi:hypothetical protein
VRAAFGEAGAGMMGLVVSPLLGAEGNVEFLAHLRRGVPGGPVDVEAAVEEARRRSGGG